MKLILQIRKNAGAKVLETAQGCWRLEIPAGPGSAYRWAQLDDHLHLPRRDFPLRAPVSIRLRARVSSPDLPGTWGFGFWNDPFSASFGISGTARRLPVLPNTAWFFFAGRPNYLSLRDTKPAQGFLAAVFSSRNIPSLLFAPGLIALPLLAFPLTARLLRKAARFFIREDSRIVSGDPTEWHDYRLGWSADRVQFFVDDAEIFSSAVVPRPPLGLAIWIDNQYAAFPPSGRLRMGTSPNPEPAWLELENLEMNNDFSFIPNT
jgi:hypothetical protein